MSPSLPLAQPSGGGGGVPYSETPALALCKAERKAQHSTQLEPEVALAEFHSNLF